MENNYPAPRVIPDGKILLAEYGDKAIEGNRAIVELIDNAPPNQLFPGRHQILAGINLIWSSPGFEMAGAVMRWTNGFWSVRWFNVNSNTYHGTRYKPDDEGEAKARDHFRRLTTD